MATADNASAQITPSPQPQSGSVIGGGAVAGLIAGAVMVVAGMWFSSAIGAGSSLLIRSTATTLAGVTALVGGSGSVLAGWGIYLAVATVLGIVYSIIGWRQRKWRSSIAWSVPFAIIIWFLMTYWLLPGSNPAMSAYVRMLGFGWFWLHIVYGVVLSLSAPLRSAFARPA